MIITENIIINNREFVRTYSDIGMMIKQNETGNVYSEAIDIEGAPYTYTETDTPIERDLIDSNIATAQDYENALAEFGVKI